MKKGERAQELTQVSFYSFSLNSNTKQKNAGTTTTTKY